jgi:hypothetical protein
MTKVPTYTYAGGVLAPGLYGRVDLNKYMTGLKKAVNFQVSVEGGVFKRFGLYYVTKPKYQDKECKLVPWKIADDDSYMLEIGHQYIRFIRFGGPVSIPGGHVHHADNDVTTVSGVMELPTTYTESQVRELKITFANDIAYVFHKNHPPRQIKRLGLYDWSLTNTNFAPNVAGPTGLAGVWEHYWGAGTSGSWLTVTGATDFAEYKEIQRDYVYKIAALMPDGLWTLPSAPVTISADLGYPAYRIKLTWTAKAGALEYKIYKSENGIFGFIGTVPAGTLEFIDNNIAPSFSDVPVKIFDGFDKDDATQYPRVGEFYKQRLAMAASKDHPQKFWISRPLFFNDLTSSIPLQDNDAIIASLVGRERQTINHMIQLKKFIVFTDAGEWIVSGANGQALTAASFDPVQETAYGSDPYLSPKPIGDRILFIENISGAIRDMGYDLTSDAYKADDLSRLARHLFENKRVISWDYAAFPNNLISCVTDAGTVAQMAYVREHEIWGWSEFDTFGRVLDTASVSEINQHGEYFQVERKINGVWTKFIERTEVPFTDKIEQMFYVDCGLTYFNRKVFTDLSYIGTTATFTCVGHGYLVGDEIRLETDQWSLHLIVTDTDGDEVTADTKYDKPIPPVPVDEDLDTDGYSYLCADTFSGFDHLEGMYLTALADGKVVQDLLVTGGEITIPFKAAWLHAGLGYDAELETLDLDDERAAGRYIDRTVDRIDIRLKTSRGVFAGASGSERELVEIDPRSDEPMDEPNRALDGVYEIPAHTSWGKTAGVRVKAPYPLPANILSIVPDLVYGS